MDRDPGLERLLDLDGFVAEVGGGFWVKVDAVRVPSDPRRPHGVAYSLSLHAPGGLRVFGIDNAHPARVTGGPAGRSSVSGITCTLALASGRTDTVTQTRFSTTSGGRSAVCLAKRE
jgi:hypothetical protein